MAARLVRDAVAASSRNYLRDQSALSRCRPGPLSRRRRACWPHDPDRGRRRTQSAHGQPCHCRLAQHQRGGCDPLELLRTMTVKDLAEMFPERFTNKTNGVTPRRWLLLANPTLARAISDAIGDDWVTDL